MNKRRLGASDLDVSQVGFGCNNFGMKIGVGAATAVLHACFDEGIDVEGAHQVERDDKPTNMECLSN